MEVDAAWQDQKLVVELDGYDFHATRAAFHRDRARDRGLTTAGWTVIRITWRDLSEHVHELAAQLRTLLR